MKLHKILSFCAAFAVCAALSGCAEKSEVRLESPAETSSQTTHDSSESSVSGAFSENSGNSASSANSTVSSVNSTVSSTSTSGADSVSGSGVAGTASSIEPQSSQAAESLAHSHEYSAEKVSATCTEGGYTVYKCSCGAEYTSDKVEAAGHSYETSVKEPTCTEGGYTTYTCKRCGYSYKEDSAAAGHKYSSNTVSPTCNEGGYTVHTCERCGNEYKDEQSSALGHSWGAWSVYKSPTASAEGERRRGCSRCNETQSEPIARLVSDTSYADRVVELVNAERAKYGLSPLTVRNDLTEYAQTRSTEIVTRFEHVRPDGSKPLPYVLGLSGIHTAGENIAWGQSSPEAVMNAWMNSEGHRNNILSSKYTMIGVGCYKSGGTLYWTQIFGG